MSHTAAENPISILQVNKLRLKTVLTAQDQIAESMTKARSGSSAQSFPFLSQPLCLRIPRHIAVLPIGAEHLTCFGVGEERGGKLRISRFKGGIRDCGRGSSPPEWKWDKGKGSPRIPCQEPWGLLYKLTVWPWVSHHRFMPQFPQL